MRRDTLNTSARVFGACYLVSLVLQGLMAAMYWHFGDTADGVDARLFGVAPGTLNAAAFYSMSLMKALALTLFLVPWVALSLVARSVRE